MYSDQKALQTAFEEYDIHGLLAQWFAVMEDCSFENGHVHERYQQLAENLL